MKLYIALFTILFANNLFSQSIRGKIVDTNNNPIEFAEIIAYENNEPLISELSDNNGEFTLILNKNGNFKIIIRQLGVVFLGKEILVDTDIDIGLISIDNSKQLSEITISARRKLIEKKADRLIYNVQSSVFSSGISSLELLRNVPRIDPASEGLRIIGRSHVLVMVNDRLLNISGEELINHLKTIRSENIDRIEIITSPSAKYAAEGNSGIINIVLREKTNLGFDGNISSELTQRTKGGVDNSLNVNYSTENLILGYTLFHGNDKRFSNHKNDFFFVNEIRNSIEETERKNKSLSHNFNLDYQFLRNINVGFYLNLRDWDIGFYRDSKVRFLNNNSIIRSQNLPAETYSNYGGLSLSPYMDIKLDTRGSKLKLYYNNNNSTTHTKSLLNSENYNGDFHTIENFNTNKVIVDNKFNVHSLGADLEYYAFETKFDLGLKFTNFRNTNDIKFFNTTTGTDVIDNNISNNFRYNEKLFAAYLNFSRNINEKLYLSAGLRYEYTNIEGVLVTQNIINTNFYGNLFPNLSVMYEPNDNHSYSLSYNKRIFRPRLFDLNPFRIYRDANNYEVGNPNLLPSITDNIEIGYVYKGNLFLTIFGSRTSDSWAFIVNSEDNNNTIVTQPKNVLTTHNFGSEIGFNWEITNRITNYSSANFSYNKSSSSHPNLPDKYLRGFNAAFSSNTTIALNKDNTNRLFVNKYYATPGIEEMFFSKSISSLRIGTSLAFFSNKLNINATLSDPFNTTIARNTVNFESFQLKNRIFNDNRSFRVSITYKFGDRKAKRHEREIDTSEKDRLIKE